MPCATRLADLGENLRFEQLDWIAALPPFHGWIKVRRGQVTANRSDGHLHSRSTIWELIDQIKVATKLVLAGAVVERASRQNLGDRLGDGRLFSDAEVLAIVDGTATRTGSCACPLRRHGVEQGG